VVIPLLCLLQISKASGQTAASPAPNEFSRTFQWTFKGETYKATMDFRWDTYNFYKERPRAYDSYAIYTYDKKSFSYLDEMVQTLERKAKAHRLTKWETLEMITAFVQQLEYVREEGEYPKFPIETLAEKGGDCEDTSLLLAAIFRTMGYDAILVNPPGHMSVALACSDCEGRSYHRNGRKYYYIETTSPGFAIGEIPKEYRTTRDKLYNLDSPLAQIRLMNEYAGIRSQQSDYYVQEDGVTRKACPATGDCVVMTHSMRNVIVNGEQSTTTSVFKWIE
jgi:hypothetical protein